MGRAPRRAPSAALETVVGVISDTHGLLRPEAVAALAGVDLIVHAGDIGAAAVLAALRAIAPVIAVRGNNDRDAWAESIPEIATTEVRGIRLCVVHDIKEFRPRPGERIDVVIHGHSHRPSIVRREGLTLLNPGSAGPRRFTLPIAVARLRVGPAGVQPEIVELALAPSPEAPRAPDRRLRKGPAP